VAVPTSYTEASFSRYLLTSLDQVGVTLGWDVTDLVVNEAVYDALFDYGETDITAISGAPNLRRIRALGRRAIWRAVVQATSDYYSITDNGQRLERQQVNAQARQSLTLAEQDCIAIGAASEYGVTVHAIVRPHDPYAVLDDDVRVTP